jgi:pyruvate formate lyase activating enzyme
MKEASFYEKLDNLKVKCLLCPHECLINNNENGICAVRKNQGGTLFSLVYGKTIAENTDPIEKKPLYHFMPGTRSFSLATVGCNFKCKHCQNFEISQMPRDRNMINGKDRSPEELVEFAKNTSCDSISFTYSEPTIFYEFARDIAKLSKAQGLKNIMVTNGYINSKPLVEIAPYIDGANIDLKAFSDDFYKKICGARLQPVLDSIKLFKKLGIWIEITTLIIPGLNDNEEELKNTAEFIASVGKEIPWHVTAFYPTYNLLEKPRTSIDHLIKAREIGINAGLRYIFTGNIPGYDGENTYCYGCKKLLIERTGFKIENNYIKAASCPECNTKIDGYFQ